MKSSLGMHIRSGLSDSMLLLAVGAAQRQSLAWSRAGMMGMPVFPWLSVISSLLAGLD